MTAVATFMTILAILVLVYAAGVVTGFLFIPTRIARDKMKATNGLPDEQETF